MHSRDTVIKLRISKEDLQKIHEKMAEAGIENRSAYIRKMALDGYCIRLELEDITEMVSLLRYCSNNLNQYAKKANETGSIYFEDILDLRMRLDRIWEGCKDALARLASI